MKGRYSAAIVVQVNDHGERPASLGWPAPPFCWTAPFLKAASSHPKDRADSRRKSLVALRCRARQRFIPVGRDVEIGREDRKLLCGHIVDGPGHAVIEMPVVLN